jgi:hypothetical protein
VSTIRERDAEIHPDEWGWVAGTAGQSGDRIAEDRRALLAPGDALAEAAQAYLDHLNVEQGPDNSEQMLTWAETDYRLVEALRPAIAAWKAATG